jgi:phage minor structural protein
MAIKSVLTKQTDFTGEFPAYDSLSGLWRFNDAVSSDHYVSDSSKHGRNMKIVNYAGTTATLRDGQKGKYVRFNTTNPSTEKSYLHVVNDGSIFENIGNRIVVGGWINPTTYSVGSTYVPIFNTRQGPGQPIFYLSLLRGNPRIMLYNASGTLILDKSFTPAFSMVNGGWYFVACVIDIANKNAQFILGDRSSGEYWLSEKATYTDTLNTKCVADIVMGMHSNSYWWAGGFDDWFLDCDSELQMEDLRIYFLKSLCANGGDTTGNVDALSNPGTVVLRAKSGVYPESGVLTTIPVECEVSGSGRVAIDCEYRVGVTAVAKIETSTSDDLVVWTDWQEVETNGELRSTNQKYVKYRITLTSTSGALTPSLLEIKLHELSKVAAQKLGFAKPYVLDENGAWEAVLENAYDVIVTGEVNGADILEFKLPFHDKKRAFLENEKQIKVCDDVYRIRTITDTKDNSGLVVTEVYAEALFYDLAFSVEKENVTFDAENAQTAMAYALKDTEWSVGTVNVVTKRTWKCTESNALAILRKIQVIHGGDLVFDCANRLVHLYAFSGANSGVLFCYKKNMKSIQKVVDTRSLITRLYAYGSEGMTFASINGGKPYVEDFSFTKEVRINTLDCSNFTNPYQMLEYTRSKLEEYSSPRISYVMTAMDLSVLTGYEHETWNLGDIVTVDDKELKLSVQTRIVRRQYNLQEPWNTVIELSTTLRELGDATSQWDSAADTLASTDLIGSQDVKDLVPFNHLKNSRADNEFAYWENSGFEVDITAGCSGSASFKCKGASGMTLSMAQTVVPANRDSYTFSAQIASNDLEKGANGQVGIEVTFEYEDGTTETRFIDLY